MQLDREQAILFGKLILDKYPDLILMLDDDLEDCPDHYRLPILSFNQIKSHLSDLSFDDQYKLFFQ